MKINDVNISNSDQVEINRIISEFVGSERSVTECTLPKYGRSIYNKTHYCLQLDNSEIISIKRAYADTAEIIQFELFMATIRQILSVPHYKIEKKHGFPIPGWEEADYMLIEKGQIGARENLNEKNAQDSIRKNRNEFLRQMAKAAAMNFLFGISDRTTLNHVWDKNENLLYSIDNEILASSDEEVPSSVKSILDFLVGKNWYDEETLRNIFTECFNATWQIAEAEQSQIINCFTAFNLQKHISMFSSRLRKGAPWVLQRIMS